MLDVNESHNIFSPRLLGLFSAALLSIMLSCLKRQSSETLVQYSKPDTSMGCCGDALTNSIHQYSVLGAIRLMVVLFLSSLLNSHSDGVTPLHQPRLGRASRKGS
jgi:hypothetical protein